jgi:hypothetical protein
MVLIMSQLDIEDHCILILCEYLISTSAGKNLWSVGDVSAMLTRITMFYIMIEIGEVCHVCCIGLLWKHADWHSF